MAAPTTSEPAATETYGGGLSPYEESYFEWGYDED